MEMSRRDDEITKVFKGLILEALARCDEGKYSIAHLTAEIGGRRSAHGRACSS
jgi:hypothetical protein